MRKIMIASLFLSAITLSAQTTTTTTVSLTSAKEQCPIVSLFVIRSQNGEVLTRLDFSVRSCDAGNPIIAGFSSPIPNADFNTDRQGAHLLTTSPYGPVKVDWTITKDFHNTYDQTWTWTAPNNIRQTQNDDTQSARAVGNIGSWTFDRVGYLVNSVVRK